MSDPVAFDWSMANGQSSFEQQQGSSETTGLFSQGQSSSFSLPSGAGHASVAGNGGGGGGSGLVSNFNPYDFSTYGQFEPPTIDQTPGAGPSSRPFQQSHWGNDIPPLPQYNIGALDGGNGSSGGQPWLQDAQWQFQGMSPQNPAVPPQAMFVNPADLHGMGAAPADRKPSPAQLAAATAPQQPAQVDRKPTRAELDPSQASGSPQSTGRPVPSSTDADGSPLASLSQTVSAPNADVKPGLGPPVLPDRQLSTRSPLRYMLGAPPATSSKDSSSLDAPPPKPAKPQPPAEVVDMRLINSLTRPDELQRSRPAALFKYLRPMVSPEGDTLPPKFSPTPDQLRQILKQLNTGTTAEWRRLLGDSPRYCETIGMWFKSMHKEPQTWAPAIAPLFLLLSKTDMASDLILEYKISRYAKSITDKVEKLEPGTVENVEGIVIAFKRYHDYLVNVLMPANRRVLDKPPSSDAPKKRKSEDAGPGTGERPAKRSPPPPAISTARASSAAPTPAAKAARPGAPSRNLSAPIPKISSTGGSSTTNSFFKPAAAAGSSSSSMAAARPGTAPATSASTGAARRPVTAAYVPRASTVAGRGSAAPAASSSGTSSLLNSVLKSLGAPAPGAAAPGGSSRTVTGSAPGMSPVDDVRASKPNKKGFSVRFHVDEKLTEVKHFTEEAWELEWPPWFTTEDIAARQKHQMAQDEGMAFKTHLGDDNSAAEPREWYEPFLVDDSPLPPPTPEVLAQEERERGILAVQTAGSAMGPDETGVCIVTDSHETRRVSLAAQTAPDTTGGAASTSGAAPYSAYSTASTGAAAPALSTVNLGDLLSKIGPISALTPAAPPPVPQSSFNYGAPAGQAAYGEPATLAGGYGLPGAYGQPASYGGVPPGAPGWVDPMAAPRQQYTQGFGPAPQQPQQQQQPWGGNAGGSGKPTGGRGGYRTKPCQYFIRGGFCRWGDQCTFLHEQP